MKDSHTVWNLYKLSEAEKNELQKKYSKNANVPEKPDAKETAASETVHTEKTEAAIPEKPQKNNHTPIIAMVCGIIIGVALCAVVMIIIMNNNTNVQTSSGKTASVAENSTKVSSKISEAESSSQSSNVEVTDNYTFDNSTGTLTVLSDAYFESDYEKFIGTYDTPSLR